MKYCCFLLASALVLSCQPKVLSFSAEPTRVRPGDSVHLMWTTKGAAAMSFYRTKVYVPPDSVETWEFILTASRGKKVSAPSIRQVVVGQQQDMLALSLDSLAGDSLVFSAQKDIAFQAYVVNSLTVRGGEPITVRHAGQTCVLMPGVTGVCMQGLPYSGPWGVKRRATAGELADRHQRPGNYFLLATITSK